MLNLYTLTKMNEPDTQIHEFQCVFAYIFMVSEIFLAILVNLGHFFLPHMMPKLKIYSDIFLYRKFC